MGVQRPAAGLCGIQCLVVAFSRRLLFFVAFDVGANTRWLLHEPVVRFSISFLPCPHISLAFSSLNFFWLLRWHWDGSVASPRTYCPHRSHRHQRRSTLAEHRNSHPSLLRQTVCVNALLISSTPSPRSMCAVALMLMCRLLMQFSMCSTCLPLLLLLQTVFRLCPSPCTSTPSRLCAHASTPGNARRRVPTEWTSTQ